jgi:hypothetical protein
MGTFKEEWKEWNNIFVQKWKDKLPAHTDIPPPSNGLSKAGDIDLRGKVKIPRW